MAGKKEGEKRISENYQDKWLNKIEIGNRKIGNRL